MTPKKHIQPGERVGLKLTKAQRSLLLDSIPPIPSEAEQAIRSAAPDEPIWLTLDDLEDLGGHVAALANHAGDKALEQKLDRISRRVEKLLASYTDEPAPSGEAPSRFALDLINLVASEEPHILPLPRRSKEDAERFPMALTAKQREALVHATRLRGGLKDRIDRASVGIQVVEFTRKELVEIAEEIDTSLAFAPSASKRSLRGLLDEIGDLLDSLEGEPSRQARPPAEKGGLIYLLKVTLKDIEPPIWRRIQVPDCTLGELHEVLQVAMGWEGDHLHQFIVRGQHYGPRSPEDADLEMETEDEEALLLSQVAGMGKRVRFTYEYDFGDGWRHEIALEKKWSRSRRSSIPGASKGRGPALPRTAAGRGATPTSSKRWLTRSTRATRTRWSGSAGGSTRRSSRSMR